MKRTVTTILVAVLAMTLLACSETDSAAHNDADVAFATDMIPHHAQAVEMSDILLSKDGIDPQVLDLAEQIKAAQAPEIETMSGWLEEWGEAVPPTSGMDDMEEMPAMDGMMSPQDMAELESATGDAATRLYLEQMTEHHAGAIDMAERETDDGSYPEAVALARSIIETQQAEIETMADLLATL